MQFTRESIFVSTIRSFCTAFAALLGVLIALGIAFFALGSMGSPDLLPPKAEPMISIDADGNREILPITSPAILRINIHGEIGKDDLTAESIENLLLDSRDDLLAHNRVKGILLHFDTPGGTETDSEAIYQLLMSYKAKYKVPVYGYIDGLCCSGGMYISCACDKLYSGSTSIIGSIGVIMGPSFNFSQAMEKYGVQSITLTQGKDKDMLNPFRPFVPGEDASLRAIMATSYQQFVDTVTKARSRLDKQKLVDEYGAQVYSPETAESYGYIDVANSSYSDALKGLAGAADIASDERYQVVLLAPPRNFLKDLVQSKCALLQGKVTHTLQLHPNLPPEFSGKLLYLYLPPQ